MGKSLDNLNPQQERFAILMAKGEMKPAQCYAAAGYKSGGQNASRLSRNPRIRARIRELQAKAERKAVVDIAYVITSLKTVAEASMERHPIEVADGEIVEKLADASAANRALELLGKTMGAFVDRTQIDLSESTRKHIERLVQIVVDEVHDPDTVRRLIARLEGELGGGNAAD